MSKPLTIEDLQKISDEKFLNDIIKEISNEFSDNNIKTVTFFITSDRMYLLDELRKKFVVNICNGTPLHYYPVTVSRLPY